MNLGSGTAVTTLGHLTERAVYKSRRLNWMIDIR
jgi:hypothetical protein